MSDARRMVLIALGVALLVVILVPAIFMSSMMSAMLGGGMMGVGSAWVVPGLVVFASLAGGTLLFIGLRR